MNFSKGYLVWLFLAALVCCWLKFRKRSRSRERQLRAECISSKSGCSRVEEATTTSHSQLFRLAMGNYLKVTNLTGMKLMSVILVLHSLALYSLMFQRTERFQNDQSGSVSGGGSPNLGCAEGDKIRNAMKANVRHDLRIRLDKLISRRAEPRDPELIALVRDLLDPPSRHMVKPVRKIVETPQSVEALRLLKGKRKGFFVEVGALDGERSSNTIFLEQQRGWTGLLIEMDPYYYTQLMGKSRRSWSINACISPYQYPVEMQLKEASGGAGKLIKESDNVETARKRADVQTVPCFTLETMLLALNQSHVDYFSLDVEGFELEVLQTIPFDKLNITVLSVEYVHGEKPKKEYEIFMSEKGYRVHRDIHLHKPEIALFVDDFIFVRSTI